jgi:hypothetical protein
MKIVAEIFVALGTIALVPGLTAQEKTVSLHKHRELTVWVSSPTGSHIGNGYASTYLTNIPARTIAKENPNLRNAIHSLDGLGMLSVKGFGLLPAAVAWQTQIRMRKLIEQQAETGLSYGELLMANSLAAKSNEAFADVVAMRARTRTWGELADQLRVDPGFIVARAETTAERIRAVDFRNRHRQQHDNTTVTSVNPHTQQQHHH